MMPWLGSMEGAQYQGAHFVMDVNCLGKEWEFSSFEESKSSEVRREFKETESYY